MLFIDAGQGPEFGHRFMLFDSELGLRQEKGYSDNVTRNRRLMLL
jgi:hypothetical protein